MDAEAVDDSPPANGRPPARPPRRDMVRGTSEQDGSHHSQQRNGTPEVAAQRDACRYDVYGFKLDGKVDWETYHLWQQQYAQGVEKRRGKWQKLLIRHPGRSYLQTQDLKKLLRKGLVEDLRGRVWMEVSGASLRLENSPALYSQLLEETGERCDRLEEAINQIELDLPRTFPEHADFRPNLHAVHGEDAIAHSTKLLSLRRVLRAYARRNKVVGYCQGMNFIAGMMLLFLEEQQVFWLLVVIIEEMLPPDYYSRDLSGCNVFLRVFQDVLARRQPKLWKHMQNAGLGVEVFCLEWFIALFSKTMPTETVVRVWDAFFLEGYKIVFRIGLAVLQMYEKQLLAISESHELFAAVQGLGCKVLDADHLLKIAFAIQLKRTSLDVLRDKHRAQLEAENAARQQRANAKESQRVLAPPRSRTEEQ